ncbi:hypothetical protein [Chitinophaga sp. CF418]|nr:hypothetical protein [Chitinophaga sp. CF418]SHN22361.1 hypothetical protein SAMN05216311_10739 [Chitinophaga sp. CF418]
MNIRNRDNAIKRAGGQIRYRQDGTYGGVYGKLHKSGAYNSLNAKS